MKRKLPLPGAAAAAHESAAAEDALLLQAEFVLSEEVHKVRMAAVKREEDAIGGAVQAESSFPTASKRPVSTLEPMK